MPNNISTTQYLTNETLVRLVNYTSFIKVANRQLEEDFRTLRLAPGRTLNYRKEQRFLAGEGASAKPSDYDTNIAPLTIEKQFHSLVNFDGFELTFDRVRDRPYLDMMLIPRAKALAYAAEKYVAFKLQTQLYYQVGTPGVPITFATITEVDALMTEVGIPEDGQRYFAISPGSSATLSQTLYNSFNKDVNTGALMDGFIGHLSGFNFFKSNFLRKQVAGAGDGGTFTAPAGYLGGGIVTNGPILAGNLISVSGVASNQLVFNIGDKITLEPAADVFLVNFGTYEALSTPAQFVVTAPVFSTGTTANITVSPTIITTGVEQNLSAPIPQGAQILLAQTHNESVAFHSSALVFAAPALKELRGGIEAATAWSDVYKLAIVYSLGGDIVNYRQNDRMDIICGAAINGEMGVIVMS